MKRLLAAAAGILTLIAGEFHAADPALARTSVSTRTLLSQLTVAAEHPNGYSRSLFPLWADADHDGCDTRQEVLITEARRKPAVGADCRLTGGVWVSPYDGTRVTDSSDLDIDHLVPLEQAWASGASRWTTATRERYANDLGYGPDLVAVTAHANRSKGDAEPSSYLPPRRAFDCTYEAWWVAVKWRWHLSVDTAEKTWLWRHLKRCGWPTVARPSRPSIGSGGGGGSGGGSGGSRSGAVIASIAFNSPGRDTGSNASLNAEQVRLRTTAQVDLSGWTLRDSSTHIYHFHAGTVAAGRTVTVHTGRGSDTATDRYWNFSGYIWNNTGDTATLRNAAGTLIDRCRYTSADDPTVTC